jgi:hypothetical protein
MSGCGYKRLSLPPPFDGGIQGVERLFSGQNPGSYGNSLFNYFTLPKNLIVKP